ncbi:phenazine biosynthesis FMN-dependent oxidase PhzG [Streptomyces sp. NPDC003758]|uniref:Phenazine biosynthesis FMN-dependent oxidase PhzG n=1 Tax=Streptomyces cynarae TaxID=2981134 RepID=A0ABY6E1R8_9ACTN|nr:phenazine biosynthesis FMN-dependent oxidase PhzG [Streptomyces cynarae]UXY19868.1 phenazine biosynthesis FMN-dependent oxidase PhzG [Streptomyces cynarae]
MSTTEAHVTATPVDPPFPDDPIGLLRTWFGTAAEEGVREPGAMALATADEGGRPSSRTVQVNTITDRGLVFTTHAGSRKGRELARRPRASAVLYWRENGRQIVLEGPVERLPDAEADHLWAVRPVVTHAMSTVSRQSEPLDDEERLRAEAARLTGLGALPRPESFAGYLLTPDAVEFWQARTDRLHHRLVYQRTDRGWTTSRLQP